MTTIKFSDLAVELPNGSYAYRWAKLPVGSSVIIDTTGLVNASLASVHPGVDQRSPQGKRLILRIAASAVNGLAGAVHSYARKNGLKVKTSCKAPYDKMTIALWRE